MSKHYLALVKGSWQVKQHTVNLKLGIQRPLGGERMTSPQTDGKSALSIFTTYKRWPEVSLMRVKLLTGRMHQIRVHAAALGHPIAGDRKYGEDSFNRKLTKFGIKRLFLHAEGLELHEDLLGKTHKFRVALPDDLTGCLKKFEAL